MNKEKLSKANQHVIEAFNMGYLFDLENNVIHPKGHILKIYLSKSSYPRFSLDRYRKVMVHKFKAYFLYGEKMFDNKIEVRHKNGNIHDWDDQNILLGTHSENMMDQSPEQRKSKAKRAASFQQKFTDSQIKEMRELYASGSSLNALKAKYGCAKSTLSYIVNRKTYSDVE